jgi:UDP-N-acetylglucosamine--N-acetylmuramyl-(pentapeptide) pyrophosphoryl-undecaprenol N-acetylglucosamine transferase
MDGVSGNSSSLKLAVACGGTGGHVIPGVATATVLRDRGHAVSLWMTGKDVETRAMGDWPGEIHSVPALGFPSSLSIQALKAAYKMWRASRMCRTMMAKEQPDALLAMGSYASSAPVFAARGLHLPYVLHEANVIPGRAISFLAKRAAAVACSFEETRHYMPGIDLVMTGMPLRHALHDASADHVYADRNRDLFTVLVMGGSGGAHALNNIASEALCALVKEGYMIHIAHLTGTADETWVRERYQAAGVQAEVRAFDTDMARQYRTADLAICRAGASTCAELSVFALPALLVPYPYASRDHQTINARALEKSGAADVVPESDLSADWLKAYIAECIKNPRRLARLSASMKARTAGSSAERLADLVEHCARQGTHRHD